MDAGSAGKRVRMVADQLRPHGIGDARVLEAMAAVPRERFVSQSEARRAYDDVALPIDEGQTISQPFMVARMTELLATRPGDRILEIGTGSGYQAAILAELGCRVTSMERLEPLATSARTRLASLGYGAVDVRVGDGTVGLPAEGPWDGIVVTAGAPRIPDELREQLADGARLVIPVGPRERQLLMVVTRHGDTWDEVPDVACVFVPLIGAAGFDGDGP